MRVFHQKNLDVYTVLASLPVFEIVFAASIALYHQCCAALSCIATAVSFRDLCGIAESFCWLNGETILALGNILRFFSYKRDIVKYIHLKCFK